MSTNYALLRHVRVFYQGSELSDICGNLIELTWIVVSEFDPSLVELLLLEGLFLLTRS